jgi:hypothetical protein
MRPRCCDDNSEATMQMAESVGSLPQKDACDFASVLGK